MRMNPPDFLNPALIRQHATEAGLDQTVIEPLTALAQRVISDPGLLHCAKQLHAQTYQRAEVVIEPTAASLLGAEANKLYLLLAVDALPQMRAAHQRRGIPDAITRETYSALPEAAREFAAWHTGEIGTEGWILRYWFGPIVAPGELYRLGRLEFILQPFAGNLRLYRHAESGRVQALAEAGVQFTAGGYWPFAVDEATQAHYGWPPAKANDDCSCPKMFSTLGRSRIERRA